MNQYPCRLVLIFLLVFLKFDVYSQNFEIIADNSIDRGAITDTIRSGNFILGVNSNGGGYITEVSIPGIGNIMGG